MNNTQRALAAIALTAAALTATAPAYADGPTSSAKPHGWTFVPNNPDSIVANGGPFMAAANGGDAVNTAFLRPIVSKMP
ncbi:hypothetical protein ADK54_41365 [Streptomyces sp. WM6378]|nr:hypothetical protein ADK54_41365 [Streptomyces sp. WM6378]